jgi:hypothetical protein
VYVHENSTILRKNRFPAQKNAFLISPGLLNIIRKYFSSTHEKAAFLLINKKKIDQSQNGLEINEGLITATVGRSTTCEYL